MQNIDQPVAPKNLARSIRAHALRMVHRADASHIGSCLSMADILGVLYSSILRVDPQLPNWDDRDRFILSKGHGAAAVYAVLAECGFFPVEWLDHYCGDGSHLTGHITNKGIPGVDVSTGSLGHGLAIGCGIALAGKRDQRMFRTFVMLSDGECDEGSTWEAIMFASHHRLDNLVALVDYNKIQSFGWVKDVLNLEPLVEKWRSFRWSVREIDGHSISEIQAALFSVPTEPGKPTCIIAHTIKGKGVSFMENRLIWHYKAPNAEQLAQALAELEHAE